MTLAQLLECDAATLEKMSDAELLEHFKPYLDVTRPERARTIAKKQTQHEPKQFISPGKKRAMEALSNLGIDMDLFKKGKRR
jgi:hypothetical protein